MNRSELMKEIASAYSHNGRLRVEFDDVDLRKWLGRDLSEDELYEAVQIISTKYVVHRNYYWDARSLAKHLQRQGAELAPEVAILLDTPEPAVGPRTDSREGPTQRMRSILEEAAGLVERLPRRSLDEMIQSTEAVLASLEERFDEKLEVSCE